jgi:hypothetical protein
MPRYRFYSAPIFRHLQLNTLAAILPIPFCRLSQSSVSQGENEAILSREAIYLGISKKEEI